MAEINKYRHIPAMKFTQIVKNLFFVPVCVPEKIGHGHAHGHVTHSSAMFVVIIICFLLLEGCQLQPPYEPPSVLTPEEWKNKTDDQTNTPSACSSWWEVFGDPILNDLEEQALNNNYDLQVAMERVAQASDNAKIVRSRLYPQINLLPAYQNQEVQTKLYNKPLPKKCCPVKSKRIVREHQMLYFLPLSLSYEIDFWGRLRGEYKAALFEAYAQEKNLETLLLILTADLAAAYYQLRTQDSLIDLFERTIETREKAVAINRSRYESKIIDFSPVALSELDLSNVITQYYDAERQRALYENQIAVLIGTPASLFKIERSSLPSNPPQIPASLPSEILLQRPDLAAQEQTMASIHQQIGVAYASLFPTVDIFAGIGFCSPTSKDFLKSKSLYWSFGSSISQYIFDAGARYYNIDMTWSEYRESVDVYQQRVLIAFQEVEDALVNLDLLVKELESAEKSVQSANKAWRISFDRYLAGVDFYLQVADNERQLLDNQRIYQNLLGLRFFNTVQLIKSLGGTWGEQ